jgi:hypothetical protein
MRARSLWMAAALLLLVAAPAAAKHVKFFGPHPVAQRQGGGYCYIEVPHVHAWGPDKPALYHEAEGQLVFTGDPTPFGYEGPKHTFYGHHPIPGAPSVYCYLDGPHYHEYEPPESPDYKMERGVAFYVGPYQPFYYKEKPHRMKAIAAEYRPYVAARPVVEVQPPPEYHGDVWMPSPAVEIQAPQPGVVVAPPPPGVVVQAPRPGVVVEAPPPVVVAPPPPHVIVAPPQPHVIVAPAPRPVIVAPAPRPVIIAPAPRPVIVAPAPIVVGAPGVVVEGGEYHGGKVMKWKHDNGKHKGWYK